MAPAHLSAHTHTHTHTQPDTRPATQPPLARAARCDCKWFCVYLSPSSVQLLNYKIYIKRSGRLTRGAVHLIMSDNGRLCFWLMCQSGEAMNNIIREHVGAKLCSMRWLENAAAWIFNVRQWRCDCITATKRHFRCSNRPHNPISSTYCSYLQSNAASPEEEEKKKTWTMWRRDGSRT